MMFGNGPSGPDTGHWTDPPHHQFVPRLLNMVVRSTQTPNTMSETQQPAGPASHSPQSPKVVWDDSSLRSSYANVVNVTCTQEEFTLLFGTNQTWNASQSGEVKVQLSDRLIVNPRTAKRLLLLLNNVVREYETRYGELKIELRSRAEAGA